MDARTELFAYMGAALITIAGLFFVQEWYASYLDVMVVHALSPDAPTNAKVTEKREAEKQKLDSGAMPLADAKRALASRPRSSFARIAPKPSDDLTPMSGWISRPGFAGYEPRSAKAAAAPGAEGAPPGAEGAAAQPGAAAPQPAAAQQPAAQPAGGKP
jgi:hypothetical protein